MTAQALAAAAETSDAVCARAHTPAPNAIASQIADSIHNIGGGARAALGGLPADEADLRGAKPVDAQKFDLKIDA